MSATALSPHPCGSAHSAKPPFSLHPSRDGCRLDVLCMKIKSNGNGNGFPAEAGPTVVRGLISGTGFSREEASPGANNFADSTPLY